MQTLAIAYEGAGDRKKALYYFREAQQRAMSRKLDELAKRLQQDLERLSNEANSR